MSGPDYDALHARGKSLEDAYFKERDRELATRLRITSEALRSLE